MGPRDHYKANIISSVQVPSIILAPGAGSLINLVPAEPSPSSISPCSLYQMRRKLCTMQETSVQGNKSLGIFKTVKFWGVFRH